MAGWVGLPAVVAGWADDLPAVVAGRVKVVVLGGVADPLPAAVTRRVWLPAVAMGRAD
ncbi:hypothetical protein Drose_18015 [Dactylosporangium roseum]|uniref:Uncharacterized protein n=1 Tax=Dactylosporangium roseum TaxID=47989 RepID=A0ABY5ZG36_9ACTN|nr:hypothetical protein [Dactylosporangium roseum]UWZ39930.1 hypothetical protein Drose_18015 [Dactylosporangium roseum]